MQRMRTTPVSSVDGHMGRIVWAGTHAVPTSSRLAPKGVGVKGMGQGDGEAVRSAGSGERKVYRRASIPAGRAFASNPLGERGKKLEEWRPGEYGSMRWRRREVTREQSVGCTSGAH